MNGSGQQQKEDPVTIELVDLMSVVSQPLIRTAIGLLHHCFLRGFCNFCFQLASPFWQDICKNKSKVFKEAVHGLKFLDIPWVELLYSFSHMS